MRRTLRGGSDRSLIARHFPAPRFVWLRRDDKRAQAESWSRAIRTGVWGLWDEETPGRESHEDREQVAALERCALEHDGAWEAWFERNGVDALEVRFEELQAEPLAVAERVTDFLSLPRRPMQPLTLSSGAARR